MKITAGKYKGHSVKCPSKNIRPVMAKMRESLFSSLLSQFGNFTDLSFLDLFSGSAIMSLEFASRGGAYVEAVECDRNKKKILNSNLSKLDIPYKIHILDVRQYFQQKKINAFDIIYLDPPFAMKDKASLIKALPSILLKPHTKVLLHLPKKEEQDLRNQSYNSLEITQSKHYGGSALCFLSLR